MLDKNNKTYMDIALEEAQFALQHNEVPIGAIIVDLEGKIISKAHNRVVELNNPCAHAEILAIELACKNISNYRLTNYSLYVTAEPCIMCTGAIIHSRIKRVYFGCDEPKFGALKNHYNSNIEFFGGIQEEQCKNLLSEFFKQKR